MASDEKTVELLFESLSLKKVPRAGWVLRNAPRESLADHSFGAAMCALALARMEKLNEKDEAALVRRALLHDLHEARIGDLSRLARQYVKADPAHAESDMLSGTHLSPEIALLSDPRLRILAHDADKLDMLLQAIDYSNTGNRNMAEFVKSALAQIKSKSGKKLAKLALARMKK
ncbi:MAG: HD domain-containing protein [Candidatus Micrarchaeota archaeon]|nr:HD domain-containing protein [Candidatus Micrarchaeota archaeon]